MTDPLWTARLACGGHARHLQHQPAIGAYISCPDKGCRRQEKVLAVAAVTAAPGPGQPAIQHQLWEEAA